MSVTPDTRAPRSAEKIADDALGPDARAAFARQATLLGHDTEPALAGEQLVGYPVVATAAGSRDLLPVTPEQRRRRQAVFFNPAIALRRAIGQGVHDRVEAAMFADGEIGPVDAAASAQHFPFPTRAISVLHRRVAAGETWDVSVRGTHFGLTDYDDLLTIVNVGELVLEPGASVTVRGDLWVLVVQRLVCAPLPAGSRFHLGVLPTPFSVDPRRPRFAPVHGTRGRDGMTGEAGEPARTEPSFLGPRLIHRPAPGAADGRLGTDADAGGDGSPGPSGAPTKLADLTVAELVGDLVVYAGSGPGGDGGDGGHGGHGGDGGAGAPGVRALGTEVPAGRGGAAGAGGHGGRGGRGGHGGISSNVFVTVPAEQAHQVRVVTDPAVGGRGGAGGDAGLGGRGGPGGAPLGNRPDEQIDGRAGTDGTAGTPGTHGRARPAPPVFVNEDPRSPA